MNRRQKEQRRKNKRKTLVASMRNRLETTLAEMLPPPIALLWMSCAEGYVGRLQPEDPARIVIQNGEPCDACMEVFYAMAKQDAKAWPDAVPPIIRIREKCLDCDELHESWTVDDNSIDAGITIGLGHANCIVWYVLKKTEDKQLYLIMAPDICTECVKVVNSLGRITGITFKPSGPMFENENNEHDHSLN